MEKLLFELYDDYYIFDCVRPEVIKLNSDNNKDFKANIITEAWMSAINPTIEVSFSPDSSKYYPIPIDHNSRGQVSIKRDKNKTIEFNIRMTNYNNGKNRIEYFKYKEGIK